MTVFRVTDVTSGRLLLSVCHGNMPESHMLASDSVA